MSTVTADLEATDVEILDQVEAEMSIADRAVALRQYFAKEMRNNHEASVCAVALDAMAKWHQANAARILREWWATRTDDHR